MFARHEQKSSPHALTVPSSHPPCLCPCLSLCVGAGRVWCFQRVCVTVSVFKGCVGESLGVRVGVVMCFVVLLFMLCVSVVVCNNCVVCVWSVV